MAEDQFDPRDPGARLGAVLALAIIAAGLVIGAAIYFGQRGEETDNLSPQETEEVQQIIRDYVSEHPEVVEQGLKKLMQTRRDAEEERLKLNIRALGKELKDDPGSPVANPDGEITVVEFFDYECPYCKGLASGLHDLINEDKSVRFVFKEFPLLTPVSEFAARAALAARNQDKYIDFHFGLMGVRGQMNERLVLATASEAGIDIEQLKRDMSDPEIDEILARNKRLAQGLGIDGTPAFVIGETLIPGAAGIPYLKDVIEKERGS